LFPEISIALATAALLAWDAIARRRSLAPSRMRSTLFVLLGVLGALSWTEFGSLRGGRPIHYWEFFHYYMGSKYARELGYTRLYHCTAVADARAGVPPPPGAPLRSLSSKEIEPARIALADPVGCTKHFSPGRWREFSHDVAFFRAHLSKNRWAQIRTDHGYNGSPVWGIAGSRCRARDRRAKRSSRGWQHSTRCCCC